MSTGVSQKNVLGASNIFHKFLYLFFLPEQLEEELLGHLLRLLLLLGPKAGVN